MTITPTGEQQEIIDAFEWGADLVIEAGAGTGKTSTLKLLANSTRERGVYVAYNRSIADDAARAFPRTVVCKTAHSLAHAAVGRRYSHRLNAPRVPVREVVRILGINEPVRLAEGTAPLAPQQLARIVIATVDRFCYSADPEPTATHVPVLAGIDDPTLRAELARAILPWVAKAWADLRSLDGRLRFTHDVYLKLWQLSGPDLGADFVLLDEAQDSNPAVASIVDNQAAQRILVGDACQAIYGWRGAVDAMATFDGTRLYLSQSFRFGHIVAAEANKWLTLLRAQLRLRGHPPIRSTLAYIDRPDAVLCRSNAGTITEIITGLAAGRRVALVGGGGDIKRMAEAAQRLQYGEPCDHPELLAFGSWREVQEYAEESAGSDLKVFVDLIDRQGADEIIGLVDQLVDERHADLVVSTAHKAKGREWGTVRIAGDFREPNDDEDGYPGEIPREDAMLAYVAVTRAKLQLDPGGLSWVDRHVGWLESSHVPESTPAVVTVTCGTEVSGPAAAAEPVSDAVEFELPPSEPAAVDGPPFPVGSAVAYHSKRSAVFEVVDARVTPALGWVYSLQEPGRDVVHRVVSGDRLRPVAVAGGVR